MLLIMMLRFRVLKTIFVRLELFFLMVLFFQVRCCSHILNLIVKVGLELANDVACKIRNGIKYIEKSRIHKKRFYDVVDKNFYLNVTKKLRLRCVCV
ncbi:hypothetical protein Gotri_024015 [Gossypium trilobum]|uniref:Uncharacterized protein n=1 Tax=Gossypium trilobum TaxID=34281 RepID=A0A7J9DKX6_9ROSI|nr:hypothetical protein [Gossypium trilobum]